MSSETDNSIQKKQSILQNCFTVVTLNCCLWPVGIRATTQSALKDQRCGRSMIPRALQTADIGLCQEVFAWHWSDNKWISMMRPFLDEYHWIAQEETERQILRPWNILTSGLWNLVHRRFKIVSQRFNTFRHKELLLYGLTHPVGILHTVIETPSKLQIHLLNVHMLSDEGVNGCFDRATFSCFYQQEMQQVISYVSSYAPENHWVIGGDFNVDGTDEMMQQFLESLKGISWPRPVFHFHPTSNTCNNKVPFANHGSQHLKVDQFYSNMEIQSCEVLEGEDNLSDHLPVLATIVLPKC